jgi:choline-sulfatase
VSPSNLLVILSDEHMREALGCYGHPLVQTPNLDRLAARGTRFTNAYTPSPICVPARASLATGRPVHQIGCWSSAEPYHGQVPSWGHRLIDAGHRVVSIGKLHYRDTEDSNGFDEEILPLHVADGVGWPRGLLRKDPPPFESARQLAAEIGPGETSYTAYDRRIAAAAVEWIKANGREPGDRPWVLFVSFVSPHFPLIAPPACFARYPLDRIDLPRGYHRGERPSHPVVRALADFFNYDGFFDDHRLKVARAAYYGLCSFLDDNLGQVLAALENRGRLADTRVLYTTDHGEMLGHHGLWAKSVMYEEAAAIPLLFAGPQVPRGAVVDTPVSLIDCYPTILAGACLGLSAEERALPGHDLCRIARGAVPDRTILSEYHDGGSITGIFMIRMGPWKYVHYVGYPPQLFDLARDPHETRDLGENPDFAQIRADCKAQLRRIVDPETASAQAFADQAQKIRALGGAAAILNAPDFGYTPLGEAATP